MIGLTPVVEGMEHMDLMSTLRKGQSSSRDGGAAASLLRTGSTSQLRPQLAEANLLERFNELEETAEARLVQVRSGLLITEYSLI
jgi:hypothetical protein